MKLKELHKDIERYLREDCYCPNEVYSVDGFGYRLVFADSEYELIEKFEHEGDIVYLVATVADKEETPILLNIWVDNQDKVVCMERYELTEHNINQMKAYFNGEIDKIRLSEHDDLLKQTQKILSIADAVMIS